MASANSVINIDAPSGAKLSLGNELKFTLIAGPCQIESRAHALEMAARILEMTSERNIQLIYKSSFDKANRTSVTSSRGLGLDHALNILAEVREKVGVPVLTDVHESWQCAPVADVVDVLQIPAFLCRQTDLLLAAARTGRPINVKKGQFLAPWDMKHVVEKILSADNKNVMVCERGACFGYNTLVSDMRALPILKELNCPIVFDATHSVQQPGGLGHTSGGQRQFVSVLAKAATAIGVAALFLETHEKPDSAPSDGPNMIPIGDLPILLDKLVRIDHVVKS